MRTENIIAIEDSLDSIITAKNLSLILDYRCQIFEANAIQRPIGIRDDSILILDDNQIKYLANLRLYDYAGAVFVLSHNSFFSTKEKYRILRWGEGSHDGCDFPWILTDIITKITNLVSLEPENLKMLQSELEVPKHFIEKKIYPKISDLYNNKDNFTAILDQISAIIEEIRQKTRVACHANVEINGESAQIQQHFQEAINQLRLLQEPNSYAIRKLYNSFEKWHQIVLGSGEEKNI